MVMVNMWRRKQTLVKRSVHNSSSSANHPRSGLSNTFMGYNATIDRRRGLRWLISMTSVCWITQAMPAESKHH